MSGKTILRMSTIATMLLLCAITSGCRPDFEPSEYVGNISLFGVENGIAYYDVSIDASSQWNWNTASDNDKIDVANEAISRCAKIYESDGAYNYNVMGVLSDGHNAFSWDSLAYNLKLYSNGIFAASYQ